MKIKVDTQSLDYVCWFDVHSGVWVAKCLPLGVYSQGLSRGGALDAVKGAVQLLLKQLFQRGLLFSFLRDNGFTLPQRSSNTNESCYWN